MVSELTCHSFNMLSLNGSLSFSLDDIMALHTLNYRHTLLLLQPTEGKRKRESRSQGKGEREVEREERGEGDSEVRSVHIWSFMLHFIPTCLSLPSSLCFVSYAIYRVTTVHFLDRKLFGEVILFATLLNWLWIQICLFYYFLTKQFLSLTLPYSPPLGPLSFLGIWSCSTNGWQGGLWPRSWNFGYFPSVQDRERVCEIYWFFQAAYVWTFNVLLYIHVMSSCQTYRKTHRHIPLIMTHSERKSHVLQKMWCSRVYQRMVAQPEGPL